MDKLKLAVMSTQTVALLQMIVKSKHSFLMSDDSWNNYIDDDITSSFWCLGGMFNGKYLKGSIYHNFVIIKHFITLL